MRHETPAARVVSADGITIASVILFYFFERILHIFFPIKKYKKGFLTKLETDAFHSECLGGLCVEGRNGGNRTHRPDLAGGKGTLPSGWHSVGVRYPHGEGQALDHGRDYNAFGNSCHASIFSSINYFNSKNSENSPQSSPFLDSPLSSSLDRKCPRKCLMISPH
jgi:hypothetical protein